MNHSETLAYIGRRIQAALARQAAGAGDLTTIELAFIQAFYRA